MKQKSRVWRILHLHSRFDGGAQAARSVQLINAFGRHCEHAIVSADGALAGPPDIVAGSIVKLAVDFPALVGRPTPGRLQKLAQAMIGYDLVLTYGFGAMHAAMAHTVFSRYLSLPPLVHHEDEAGTLAWAPNWFRRIALGRASALVVPTPRLATIAVDAWHQPAGRVTCITPGIRTAAYAAKPRRDALPRVIKRDGELWLGTLADLTPQNQLIPLLRAFAALPGQWQLVIVGEGPQRDAIRDQALQLDLAHRVHLPGAGAGAGADPAQVLGLFDLFVPASDGESSRLAVMQAMAAGLAVAGNACTTAGDDVAALLAGENQPYLAALGDHTRFAEALRVLAETPGLRASIGAANRARARSDHDEAAMVAAYARVYGAALGQARFP